MDNQNLNIAVAPHLSAGETVTKAMRDTMLALVPVTLVAIYFFRLYAVVLVLVCLGTAALTDIVARRIAGKPHTLRDGSAVLTGLFVALLFPATTAWWVAAIATIIAVGIVKELMGGIGWNRFNPALLGRVSMILLAPWMVNMRSGLSQWTLNLGAVDSVTQATPLAQLAIDSVSRTTPIAGTPGLPGFFQLLVAFPGGAMGEVSPLALILGGAFLLYRRHINWRIPVCILATAFVLIAITGHNPFLHMVTGGIMLGAFFMATDWTTSPMGNKGKVIFGIAIGAGIALFRIGLAPTEGVAFSILIMNAFVPLIERKTRRPSFSEPKKVPEANPAAGS